jgi:hypothetical protein
LRECVQPSGTLHAGITLNVNEKTIYKQSSPSLTAHQPTGGSPAHSPGRNNLRRLLAKRRADQLLRLRQLPL